MTSPDKNSSGDRGKWTAGTLTYTTGGLVVLFFWLLWGDFAWSLKERSVPAVVQVLLKNFHASDMLTGLLIGSLPQALTMLLGPIISYRSDRHRGPWGRRIPFLLIPTPIAAGSMIGLAFCPWFGRILHEFWGASSPGLYPCILMFFGGLWTLFEFASIIANSVFGGLINDVVPASMLGRFYGLFRAFSLLAGILFNYSIFGKAETHFTAIFIGIGALYGLGFTLMCAKVKEGRYDPPPPPPPGKGGFLPATQTYFRECFTHSYYWWVFTAMSLPWMAFACANVFNVFFAKSLSMSMDAYGKCLALTYTISLVLSYFIGVAADRFHPLRAGLVVIALYGISSLLGGLFSTTPGIFAFALVSHGVLSGAWMTVTASLGQRLFPASRFAQFASALGLVMSFGTMFLSPALGKILDLSGHNYRLTYLIGAGLSLIALLTGLRVQRMFHQLGGPTAYRAPE